MAGRKNPGLPRERLFTKGASALSDRELVAILLRTGRRGLPVLALADQLLSEGLDRLFWSSPEELVRRAGIGPAKAASLWAAFELGRRIGLPAQPARPRLSDPQQAASLLRHHFAPGREELRALYLDHSLRLLDERLISQGGRNWTHAEPADVFGPALRLGASAVILAHNHPGGDMVASWQDRAATERLCQAGALLGVRLLDHLLITAAGHLSLVAQDSEQSGWPQRKEPRRR
ncbi:MAG: RadC family protein [Sulfobacillus sp.]